MKFLFVCLVCVFATAMSSAVYGGGNSYSARSPQLVGLYRVHQLVPAAPAYAQASAPSYGATAIQNAPVARSGYGANAAIDGEVLSLAQLALSLPNPAADIANGGARASY